MKKITCLLALPVFILFGTNSIKAQTVNAINTGIADLDVNLNEVNTLASKDIVAFTEMVAANYNSTTELVSDVLNSGLKPAETLMAFEVADIVDKPVGDVVNTYKANKGKGWGVVAMELGIKPGSKEFHALKDKTKNDKEKLKKIKEDKDKGNDKNKKGDVIKEEKNNKGKGNSKGKGKKQ